MNHRPSNHGAGWLARLLALAAGLVGTLLAAAIVWLLASCPLWWPNAPRLPLPCTVAVPGRTLDGFDPAATPALRSLDLHRLEAQVEVRFADAWAQWRFVFFAMQELALLLAMLLLVRALVASIARGDVFCRANVRHLRWLGLLLLVEGIYAPGVASGLSSWITGGVTVGGLPLLADFGTAAGRTGLAGAWIVLVLSEAFRQGADLRDEQSLTV